MRYKDIILEDYKPESPDNDIYRKLLLEVLIDIRDKLDGIEDEIADYLKHEGVYHD